MEMKVNYKKKERVLKKARPIHKSLLFNRLYTKKGNLAKANIIIINKIKKDLNIPDNPIVQIEERKNIITGGVLLYWYVNYVLQYVSN